MSEFLLKEGVSRAYGLYALSVIKGRALPDIRDGLKPVQRRILYAMYEAGYRYNKPFKKSARIVGEVLGKYHPHGDSSVYEALVNLAQDFGISMPLIQGQGNFGSIDGDNAASMRYTEARLAQIGEHLLHDYDKDTVAMRYNYDETLQIPAVLPAQFPNLLVNGSSGIAVGMATNIPPHNFGEIMTALIAILENENIELHEVLQYIKGPDFPTGGEFFGGSELREAYKTGRGKAILQGTCFEEMIGNRQALIIDSMPYQIAKPKLIQDITALIDEGSLSDIADVRDESGKTIRVVLELKRDANADLIKQRLFAQTSLRISVNLNMVAIHNDRPSTFGLMDILRAFLQFREEVVLKRAEFILNKALEKAHVLSGLALATLALDEVIRTIRSSENADEAKLRLMQLQWSRQQTATLCAIFGEDYIKDDPYSFSIEQVKAILDLRLQKLTKLEQNELIEELKELAENIAEQRSIIQDRPTRKALMKSEFEELIKKFAIPRRTTELKTIDCRNCEELIEKEQIVIMLTANGYIKRINLEEYRVQSRGGKGKIGHKKAEDAITKIFTTHTLAEVLFFTSEGKVFSMKAYEIPTGSATTRGRAAINLFKLNDNEKLTTILPLSEEEEQCLIFVTTKGTIRKNKLEDFTNIRANGKIAIKLSEGNYLQSVLLVQANDEILLTSSNGNSIRFDAAEIRIFESRSSEGVRAMRLDNDDCIIGSTSIDKSTENQEILCVTEKGFGKRSDINEYRKTRRGGKGVKTMNINDKTGKLIQTLTISEKNDILLMTKNSQTIRISAESVRLTGRVASGVKLIRLDDNDLVKLAMQIEEEDAAE